MIIIRNADISDGKQILNLINELEEAEFNENKFIACFINNLVITENLREPFLKRTQTL